MSKRERICNQTGKIQRRKKPALTLAAKLTAEDPEHPVRAYLCPHCHKHHLTTKRALTFTALLPPRSH